MPVVTLAAPPHPHVGGLLVQLADAVAVALALDAGDVIAVHVPTGVSATSGAVVAAPASAWSLVSIHGSDRGREKMEATRAAAEASVRGWCDRNDVDCEGVWTQWLTPLPC